MRITPLALPGCHLIEPEPLADARGFFARLWCAETLAAHGMETGRLQDSVSWNAAAFTLRGMHWQAAPHGETKYVRCTAGALHDVVIDLRPASPAYLRWEAVTLTAENRRSLHIPPGVAHGFLTLVDGTEVHYTMTAPHVPEAARGARWDDPAFGIRWPRRPAVISERDAGWPDFARQEAGHA